MLTKLLYLNYSDIKKRIIIRIFILVLLFLMVDYLAMAQLEKGNIVIGGQFSVYRRNFSNNKSFGVNNPSRYTNVEVFPSIGYHVSNNFAFGLNLGFEYQLMEYLPPNWGEWKETKLACKPGIFLRQYILILNSLLFSINENFEYAIGTLKQEGDGISISAKNKNVIFNIRPELIYFINSKIGMELSFGELYFTCNQIKQNNNSQYVKDTITKRKNFGLNLNMSSLKAGVKFYF